MKIKHMCTFMSLFIWCFGCYALQLDTPEVQVSFEIPTNPLITRTFTKDRNKITVLANYHTEKDIPNKEPEAYSPLLYAILKNDGFKISKDHITAMIEKYNPADSSVYAMISNVPSYGDTRPQNFIKKSYEKIYYQGEAIGECVLYISPVDAAQAISDDTYISLNYHICFVVEQALIHLQIALPEADINTLRTVCPDFFVQKEGLWYWAKTQTEFFNALNGKDYMRFPENVRLVRETKECILATLQIIKSRQTIFFVDNKIYTVSDNLRLREDSHISSKVITTMVKGSRVLIINIGRRDMIDGIISNWVQIKSIAGSKDKEEKWIPTGTMGWCFGGYLE